MNFVPFAFFDTIELAGSLRTRWGQFKTVTPGHRILRIRSHVKDTSAEEDRFGAHAAARDWVELANLRDEIKRRADAILPPSIDEGLVFLEMIDPGAAIGWPGETAEYFTRWSRATLAVRTNPGVLMVCGVETLAPAVGMLNVVNPRAPRAALNSGEWPFVALTIDFRKRTTE